MTLYDYLQILRARWAVIVATTLTALLAAASVVAFAAPQYKATTRMLFVVDGPPQSGQMSRAFTYTTSMVQSFASMATLPVVLDPVVEGLGLRTDSAQLAGKVSATADLDSVILRVTVTDTDPARAAKIANAVADRLLSTVNGLNPGRAPTVAVPGQARIVEPDDRTVLTGQVVSRAAAPTSPTWPRPRLLLGVGLALGLIAGVMLAVALALVNRRFADRGEVSAVTRLPVLGSVPDGAAPGRGGRRRRPAGQPTQELGGKVMALTVEHQVRTLAFTSAYDERPTVVTVDQLGGALARGGHQVLVIDSDLRGVGGEPVEEGELPDAEPAAASSGPAGLSEVLSGRATWQDLIHRDGPDDAHHLPRGQADPGPDAVTSPAMATLLAEAGRRFDVVLVKTAPAMRTADALLVSAITDGVVVVMDDAAMSRELLTDVLESLDAVGARPLGVVLGV